MSDQIYMPLISNAAGSPAVKTPSRLVIDPISRIEGHLRIEVQIEGGVVKDAWSSSTMFRGIEMILQGRDPRDAPAITQRVCGVCTTVHAIAAVRAVENALGIAIPDNARILRNLLEGAQYVQDHVIHFYHLHALDWVDILSAAQADPARASSLQKSISDWPNSSPEYFAGVKSRLQKFIDSGQLGLFANGYWGHPAYKLPAEGNLLAAAHYLEALDWQRDIIKIQAILGGKNPHPQVYVVGGMASPIGPGTMMEVNSDPASPYQQVAAMIARAAAFVEKVYWPDLKLVAGFYKEWAGYGGGPGNYLAFGDFPASGNDPASYWLPRGVINGKDIGKAPAVFDQNQVKEYIARSWYQYASGDNAGKHPSTGETSPNFTGPQPPYDFLDVDKKYSWLKAPRYQDTVMEVGPLARMLVAYAAGNSAVQGMVGEVLGALKVGPEALFSTLGRTAARGIETRLVAAQLSGWLGELTDNMNRGDYTIHAGQAWNPSSWPADVSGWGTTEAPRGALGHWVHIQNGKIARYQMVVPTTWNGSPRDAKGQRGAWEQALIGTPVADPSRPVEILRTIHSFDPCMACAVHLIDGRERPLTRIEVY